MKASMTLKPLVFAIAAVVAVAAQAGNDNRHDRDRDHHRRHHEHHTYDPTLDKAAGDATASAGRDQTINGTKVTNEATQNKATLSSSLSGSSGNIGANVAAGDLNQQANDVAIATADEKFVFGGATATADPSQTSYGTWVSNTSATNYAGASGSGNGASGNIGVNVASGNFSQQQNTLAIATASGWQADATASGSQDLTGSVDNDASKKINKEYIDLKIKLHGGYDGGGQGVVLDDPQKGGHNDDRGHSKVDKDPLYFQEEGDIWLSGSVTGWVPAGYTYYDPVKNTADLTGSLNGASGNIGVNVAAGTSNQQLNTLAVAVGCHSCNTATSH